MMKKYTILTLLGLTPLTELTTAATITLADLAAETADQTYTAGNTISNVDGVYDTSDVTFAPNFSNVAWGGASLLNASFDTDLSLYSGVAVTSVPEPSSTLLCGIASLGLLIRRNRRG